MNNVENEKFEFGNGFNDFDYSAISGIGESEYENEDLFNTEVNDNISQNTPNTADQIANVTQTLDDNVDENKIANQETDETIYSEMPKNENFGESTNYNVEGNSANVDESYLDINGTFENTEFNNDYSLPVVEPSSKPNANVDNSNSDKKYILTETPISELEELTHFEEQKIETTDIKALFDRVGVNVKEASDIFKKNTEMKEKIDSRFEELKKLQSEVEKNKKSQYDEINAYKEEVLGKLTEKKEEIEKRLNKLKDFQSSLEKERQEFEQYRKTEKEEIDRVQREIQEAYDSRRQELNHIEDVLRRQKDALDEERSQLSLDRIQYESDKNELANNLLKFNEIVDSFTNGMEKLNKEQE